MRKVILLALVLMVVAGGGMAIAALLLAPGATSSAARAAKSADAGKGKEEKGKEDGGKAKEDKGEKKEEPPFFVTVGPLIIPIIDERRLDQTLTLVVALEVHTEEARDTVKRLSPRLTDAYIRALYDGIDRGAVLEGRRLDMAAVKDKVAAASDQVLGPDVAQAVLLQGVGQRPAR